jgi:hypothetical protein
MDDKPSIKDDSETLATDPSKHKWAKNESNFDMSLLKPHACMQNIKQIGNYIHCYTGNHGMRLQPGTMLTKDADGNFTVVDIPLRDETGKVIAPSMNSVIALS